MSLLKNMELNKRIVLSQKILNEHPKSVPVILEPQGSNKVELRKTKFILPKDLSVASFIQQLRKDILIDCKETIFLFCHDNILIPTSFDINSVYQKYKNNDGFLYLTIMKENTFG